MCILQSFKKSNYHKTMKTTIFLNHYNKKTWLIAIIMFSAVFLKAQDIIIKNDKTEIKSKVTEITETTIKYKKWENMDGPLYSIAKSEVFMILYPNGQRELMNQTNGAISTNAEKDHEFSNKSKIEEVGLSDQSKQNTAIIQGKTFDFKNQKINYKPTRFNFGLQSPFSMGVDNEFRLIKNILNLGLGYTYTFPKDDYILVSQMADIYASLYANVNRLSGNYEKQDIGLFIFGNAGYGLTGITTYNIYDGDQTFYSGGLYWRLGLDYFFSDWFGITGSYGSNALTGGIVMRF